MRKLATSKFQPIFARHAFPCFDEPHLKATFSISLVHPSSTGNTALSNMDVQETNRDTPSVGLSTTVFNRSVPMSTHHLAVLLVMSGFQSQTTTIIPSIGAPFNLRMFATERQFEFTRRTAIDVILYYIAYFGIGYPLPKLDLVAVPGASEGMQAWGLVTHPETGLLYDALTSSTADKQRVVEIVAHELAHMWFGNLVTMKWWSDWWLSEGLARYVQYKGVDAAYPQWGIMEQFALNNLHEVLALDATLGSHPLVAGSVDEIPPRSKRTGGSDEVKTPSQIKAIFDTIPYSKGAPILRMIEDLVGEPVFKQGVTAYLDRLQFGNGESDDFMAELDELFSDPTGVTVQEVMSTFIQQKGFPVITVERVDDQYRLTQSRFLADPEANDTDVSEFDYKWYVPLAYITSEDTTNVQRAWFPNNETEVYLDLSSPSWIKLNHDQVGYYRVNYDDDTWVQFGEMLRDNAETFSIGDRTGLLNDAFALADASLLDYSLALGLTEYLMYGQEQEYVPWATVANKMKNIQSLIYDYKSHEDLISYVQNLVQFEYMAVNWDMPLVIDENSHSKNLLRATILDLACSFEHEDCLYQVHDRFQQWLTSSRNTVHSDFRTVVYNYGIQSATVDEWEMVKDRFHWETNANERTKLLGALASYPDAKVLRWFLEDAWESELVSDQEYLTCVQNVAANKHGERVAWDHVRSRWDELVARFGLDDRNLGRVITEVTGRFSTTVRLQELEDFFRRYPDAGAGESARVQALERIGNNIRWIKRNEKAVAEWLGTVSRRKKATPSQSESIETR